MKGLLRKDYYLIQSSLFTMFVVFVIAGAGITFLSTAWVLCVIASSLSAIISTTTITMDKTSGWRKVSCALPLNRKAVIDSKYVLNLLLGGAGFLLGGTLSIVLALLQGQFDLYDMLVYFSISITMVLLSASVAIPCAFVLSEEKSTIVTILVYPLSTLVFAAASLLFRNKAAVFGAMVLLAAAAYAISWLMTRKRIAYQEIT